MMECVGRGQMHVGRFRGVFSVVLISESKDCSLSSASDLEKLSSIQMKDFHFRQTCVCLHDSNLLSANGG